MHDEVFLFQGLELVEDGLGISVDGKVYIFVGVVPLEGEFAVDCAVLFG